MDIECFSRTYSPCDGADGLDFQVVADGVSITVNVSQGALDRINCRGYHQNGLQAIFERNRHRFEAIACRKIEAATEQIRRRCYITVADLLGSHDHS